MKKEVTKLITWENEIIELEIDFQSWINAKTTAKIKWDDWIYILNNSRFLKFANINDELKKVKYIALPQAKTDKKVYTKEESEMYRRIKEEALRKTFEWRKKNFLKKRAEILKRLAEDEAYFWLETTNEKLEEFNKLKVNLQIWYKW